VRSLTISRPRHRHDFPPSTLTAGPRAENRSLAKVKASVRPAGPAHPESPVEPIALRVAQVRTQKRRVTLDTVNNDVPAGEIGIDPQRGGPDRYGRKSEREDARGAG